MIFDSLRLERLGYCTLGLKVYSVRRGSRMLIIDDYGDKGYLPIGFSHLDNMRLGTSSDIQSRLVKYSLYIDPTLIPSAPT